MMNLNYSTLINYLVCTMLGMLQMHPFGALFTKLNCKMYFAELFNKNVLKPKNTQML